MGEAKVVSIEELMKDNPTLCLSALRVFGRCFECPAYKLAGKRGKKLRCVPHVDEEKHKASRLERVEIVAGKLKRQLSDEERTELINKLKG